jgi:Holliday junction resolvasome RuvABC endonuclease subunit
MLLGLDVSTSITGATILDENQNIIYCEAWDTRNKNKFPSLFSKAAFLKSKILELNKEYDIKEVYVEENLQSFRSGFSSAKTISTLAKINGIISFVCYEVFGKEPDFIAPTSARKWCGISVPRGENAKTIVLK